MGNRLVAVTAALVLAATAGAAAAQSDPPGDPPDDGSLLGPAAPAPTDEPPAPQGEPALDPAVAKEMATKLIEGGDEFSKKGDYYVRRKKPKDAQERYERALAAYSKAFELGGEPTVYLLIAGTEDKLERALDAAIHYRRFLTAAPDADSAQRDKATARLDILKLQFGVLALAIQPEGSAVVIDGNPAGNAPLAEPFFLAPGEHQLSITTEGYTPLEQTLTIEAGSEAERTYQLEPVPAVIVDQAPPPPPPPPPRKPPPGPSKLPMILGGTVTVGLVGGAVATGLMAVGRHDTFVDESASANRRENARTEGKNLALITDAMIAGSVIAAGITTYYYLKVYKPKVRSHERMLRDRASGVGALTAPKLLIAPWVEASGPGTAAGLVVGGSL